MAKFTLVFAPTAAPELLQVRFAHSLLGGEIRSYRGKVPGIDRSAGSFHLSAAVIALVELALKTKIATLSQGFEGFLQGERGSSAASLEQAINKPPRWLDEMFGWDQAGNSLVKRLFDRTNPGLKRPGPVALKFREEQLSGKQIHIIFGAEEICSVEQLCALLQQFSFLNSNQKNDFLFKLLQPLYEEEARAMLRATDIFSPEKVRRQLISIYTNPSFSHLIKGNSNSLSALISASRFKDRLGLRSAHLKVEEPIRVATGAVNGTAIVLLTKMRKQLGIPIEIDFDFAYGIPVVNDLLSGTKPKMPEVCLVGLGPGAKLLQDRASEYVPIMLGPRLTHRIVAKSRAGGLDFGSYKLITEESTTASFYFDELGRSKQIRKKKITVSHAEPDEALGDLNSDDARALLWFPHCHVVRDRINGVFLDNLQSGTNDQACLFFFHRKFAETPAAEAFESAIRSAWLTLLEEKNALTNSVSDVLSDPNYLRLISRITGLSRHSE